MTNLLSILYILTFTIAANGNQEICSESSSELRKHKFILKLGLHGLYQNISDLKEYSKVQPLEQLLTVEAQLNNQRDIFLNNQEKVVRFQSLVLSMEPIYSDYIYSILKEYSQMLYLRSEEINIEVADILDATKKYALRDELLALAKAELVSEYSSLVFQLYDSAESLKENDIEFLKNETFTLVPSAPGYSWSEEATVLHDYVWQTFRNSNLFSAPGGRLTNSLYTFDTIVNHKFPGLHLNLSYREVLDQKDIALDIALIFSPFESFVPISVCDFSLLDHKGDCLKLSVDEWCDLKN